LLLDDPTGICRVFKKLAVGLVVNRNNSKDFKIGIQAFIRRTEARKCFSHRSLWMAVLLGLTVVWEPSVMAYSVLLANITTEAETVGSQLPQCFFREPRA